MFTDGKQPGMAEVQSPWKVDKVEATSWILYSRQSGDINQHEMCILEGKKHIQ